jgi:mannan endo-1,4-beta-mannosidase
MFGMVSLGDAGAVTQELLDFEALLGRPVASVLRYVTWEERFPGPVCDAVAGRGALPMLIWMPGWPSLDGDLRRECRPDETGLDEILAGRHDAYIDEFARACLQWGGDLLVRFLYEFNANWYVWSGEKNGGERGGPDKVKRVWRYVVGRFRDIGARNVQWVWCVHEPSALVSLDPWNDIERYWPGDGWVDWLGIDGFNFFPKHPERDDPVLLTFDDCFTAVHRRLRALSGKPIQLMTGSGEFVHDGEPANKPAWVADMCARLRTGYDGVALVYWFGHQFDDRADWRIDSSPESLATFREQLQAPWLSWTYRHDTGVADA